MAGPPVFVQNVASNSTTSGATLVLTLAGGITTTVGNMLSVYGRTGSGFVLSTVTDSKGNAWHVDVTGSSANSNSFRASCILATAKNLVAGDTITLTASGTAAIVGACNEYSGAAKTAGGAAALDQTANAHATAGSVTVSTAANSNAGDLVLSVGVPAVNTSVPTPAATDSSSGGIWIETNYPAGGGADEAYQIGPGSASLYSCAWSFSGSQTNCDASIATYKAQPQVVTATLPDGTAGSAYSQALVSRWGISTNTWAAGAGLAGSGLSLSSAGVLSGTGGTPGSYTFTATVTDAGGNTASQTLTVTIDPAPTATMFPLPIRVELLLNNVWTDITEFVYQRDDIQISGGRVDEDSTPSPAQANLTLDNRDGRFSPGYTAGAYYPYLTRNTQIRISVVGATSSSGDLYSGYRFWGTVASWPPQSDSSGADVYVQITANGPLRQLNQGGGKGSALTRYYGSLTGAAVPVAYWPCEEDKDGTLIGSGLSGGTNMSVTTARQPLFKAVGTTFGSAPMPVVNKSTWDGLTGSFGSSGDDVFSTPGTYTWVAPVSSADVRVTGAGGGGGNGVIPGSAPGRGGGGGGEYAEEATLAVTPGSSYTVKVGGGGGGGAGAFRALGGGGNPGSDGGASSFAGDSVTVTAHGGAGGSAAGGAGGTGSANTVHHNGGAGGNQTSTGSAGGGGGGSGGTAAAGNAGSNTTSGFGAAGGAAVAGGGAGGQGGGGGPGGAAQTGGNGGAPGGGGGAGGFNTSDSYGRAGGNGNNGQVQLIYTPATGTPPANVIRFLMFVPLQGGNDGAVLVRAFTGGTIARLDVLYGAGGKIKLQGYSSAPALLFDSGFISVAADGQYQMVSVELTPSGANVAWSLKSVWPGATSLQNSVSGTQATASLGNVSEITVAPNADVTMTSISHIAVQYAVVNLLTLSRALNGYSTELGIDRFIRLVTEQGIGNAVQYQEAADHWGFESGTQSWTAANCALTNPATTATATTAIGFYSAWPADGTHSLLLTANGAGQPSATSPGGTSGQPVKPGDIVSVSAEFYAPAAHSNLFIGVRWYTSAGTFISEIDAADVAISAGELRTIWTSSATAPSTAAYFAIRAGNHNTDANGTLLYVDNVRVSPRMGAQTRKEYREFLKEVEDLDQGMMKEAKALFGMQYRTRISLINQSPVVSLDYSQSDVSQPFVPEVDDQKIKNDITVQKHKGSRVRVTLDSGHMSTTEVGRFRKQLKVLAADDAQLLALASHLLTLGTVTDERYPTITVDLKRAALKGTHIATLMSAVAAVDIGDFVQVVSLPFWFPHTTVSQLVIGYTETLNAFDWTLTFNCTPEAPYEMSVTSIRRW